MTCIKPFGHYSNKTKNKVTLIRTACGLPKLGLNCELV